LKYKARLLMKRVHEIEKIRKDAYERHREILSHLQNPSASAENSEVSILKNYHQFIRDDENDERTFNSDYRLRIARRYYDRLYREYAIIDLSRYKERKLGMRWRIEAEVIQGKGQFICGARRCEEMDNLSSYEVPFQYNERDQKKIELVKVRVCQDCSIKLQQSSGSSTYAKTASPSSSREHHKRNKTSDLDADDYLDLIT
jgi:protein FRA10AC1